MTKELTTINVRQYGKFIRKCRKEKKLTQTNVANALGISKQAISQIEKGNRTEINPDYLYEFAHLFECSCRYLLNETSNISQGKKYIHPVDFRSPDDIIEKNADKIREIYIRCPDLVKIIYKISTLDTIPRNKMVNIINSILDFRQK